MRGRGTRKNGGLMLGRALVCLALATSAPALAQEPGPLPIVGDEAAGETIFANECRTCHGGLIAPALRGVAGRPIAGIGTFGGYSDALKARSGETWTDENLARFLSAPGVFAPGTGMSKSLPDPQARANVIAFLKALAAPR